MGSGVNIIRSATRNLLINSMMSHIQRYNIVSATITGTNGYRVQDRWRTGVNSIAFFSSAVQGPTTITNLNGLLREALNFSCNASNASANGLVLQRIESYLTKDLAGKKASLSFLVRNNNFTTVTVNLFYPNATDNYAGRTQFYAGTPQVFTANSTVKFVKFENIPISPNAVNGIEVEIVYSGFSVGVPSDTALTEVMMNEGETVNPFIPFAGWDNSAELIACQRYYEVTGIAGETALASGSQTGVGFVPWRVMKRATPVVDVMGNGVSNSMRSANTGATVTGLNISPNIFGTEVRFTSGQADNVMFTGTVYADAEL